MHRQHLRALGLACNNLVRCVDRVAYGVLQTPIRPSWKLRRTLFAHTAAVEELFRPL